MKGMMVTLLMLGLTGIVNAQQFGKNDLAFGGSSPGRPAPDQNDFVANGREGIGARGSELLQLALPLNPDVIQDLRENGERSAPIGRPSQTGEVIFGFAQPLKEAKDSTDFRIVKPVAESNGALIFEFTDSDLKAVETSTLRYRFEPSEIGRYESIVVRVRGAQPQNAPYQSPTSNDQFASLREQRNIDPPDNREWGNRGNNTVDPFDREAQLGGTVGGAIDRSTTPSLPNRFAFNDQSPSARGSNILPASREPDVDSWRLDAPRQLGDVEPTFENTQRREEYMARQQNARDAELRMREQRLAQQEQDLLEQQRLQRLNSSSTGSTWDLNSTSRFASRTSPTTPYPSSSTTPNSFTGDRYASTASGMRPVDNYQSSVSDQNLQHLTSVVLDGLNSLKQSQLDLNSRMQSIESQRHSDPDSQMAAGYQATTGSGFPDRLSRNFTPSMSGLQAQIPGTERNLATNQNMTGPIYFMLICSLGLNIYLGLISRNFYVRYNELADELRETFSASISN